MCDTWSVDYNLSESGYARCMDGEERWFDVYCCVNCGSEVSIRKGDVWNEVEYRDTVYFDDD